MKPPAEQAALREPPDALKAAGYDSRLEVPDWPKAWEKLCEAKEGQE